MLDFLLISNMYPTEDSPGYGVFVKNISDALGQYGIKECSNALIRGKSRGKFNKLVKYVLFYSRIFVKYWTKYDFIYIHFPNQALPVLYPLLKIRRRKLVINLHGEDLMYESNGYALKLGKLMEKTCREFASAIVVPSTYFRDIVIERGILPKEKIIVSPSGGINEAIFYPETSDFSGSIPLRLGYVGRLEADKGILEYLQVCKCLHSDGCAFSGIVIGYGSQYEYVKRFLEENDLSRQVRLIQGIAQAKLGDFYRDMELLIFSSSRTGESLGLTGIEAMACGTPVIGSNIGGIATYVVPGYNGWLTPIHDVYAIVAAVKEYAAMSSLEKLHMRNNCVITGRKYYSSKVSKELAEELQKIDFQ